MYERIIEIIVYVLSELKQNRNISEIDVQELENLGYTSSEISTAFSWLVDKAELTEPIFNSISTARKESFRVLHNAERQLFTKDAWGELIELHSLGLITNEHIEIIIERGLLSGMREIDSQMLKQIVAQIVFNTFALNFNNARVMLRGNETIN